MSALRFAVTVLVLVACGDTLPQEPVSAESEAPAIPEHEEESQAETPPVDRPANTNVATAEDEQAEPEPELAEPEVPTLPTKMGRRISNQLRQLVGARVALPHVLNETLPNGGNRVLGIMSFSEHEACIGRYEDRAEGRAACLGEDDCVQYGTVLAEFAAPRRRTPEGHGGALTLISPRAISDLNLVCAESIEVRQLEAIDIDRDGELELVYDAIFRSEHDSFRGGGTFTAARRFLRVIRLDGTEQISVPLSSWGGDSEATEAQYARRARFEVQGAPNPVLIVEEVEYDGTDCAVDEAFFDTNYTNMDSAECTGELATLVWTYDVACDCWRTAEEAAAQPAPIEAQREEVETTPTSPVAPSE